MYLISNIKAYLKSIDLSRLFSFNMLIILASTISSIVAIKLFIKNTDIDPLIIFLILTGGFMLGIYLLKKSFANTMIPYILLQLILFWIFIDKKLFAPFGLSVKLYALVFGLGTAVAIYYLFKHFKYLWGNFPVFRLLFIFFLINIVYYFFYHSNFRVWYSDFLDIWFMSPQIRLLNLSEGMSVFSKEFGETSTLGMYLGSLTPIISIAVSLMVFYNFKSLNEINKQLVSIIKLILIGLIIYFVLALIFVAFGLSTVGFHAGRLWGDFLGFGLSYPIYLSYYLILLLGFKYYVSNIKDYPQKHVLDASIMILLIVCLILILLQINKTTIISLSVALIAFFSITILKLKIKLFDFKTYQNANSISKLSLFIILMIIVILFAYNFDFVIESYNRIETRFSSTGTFETRVVLWKYFINNWLNNLDLFKVLFGFGLDSSKEAAFFISAMLPSEIYMNGAPLPHAHSLFLELFYDYGLVALLYFGPLIGIVLNNLKNIFFTKTNINLKLFSTVSLSIIVFFFTFGLDEILRIPIAIVFFCIIGFLESLKFALSKYGLNENNNN